MDKKLIKNTPAIAILSSKKNDRISHIKIGRVFERIFLSATALGIKVHPLSGIVDTPETKTQVKKLLPNPELFPTHIFRLGYGDETNNFSQRKNRVKESFFRTAIFAYEFFFHSKELSWFGESSEDTSIKMIRQVTNCKKNNRVIIEMGSGTGPVTEEIIKKMRSNDRLIAIELIPNLVKLLRKRVDQTDKKDQVTIFEGSVQNYKLEGQG